LLFKGDSLTYHLGQNFSTYDQDNDNWSTRSCSVYNGGAWWYRYNYYTCYDSNLNGRYYTRKINAVNAVRWRDWLSVYSLRFSEMKIRPYEL